MAQFWPPRPRTTQDGSVGGVSSTAFTLVTFPVAFPSVPKVFPTARALSANGAAHIGSLSATAFQVALSSQGGGAITGTVDWVAML